MPTPPVGRAAAMLSPLLLLAAALTAQQRQAPSSTDKAKADRAPTVLTTDVTWPQRLHLQSDAGVVAAIESGLAWLRRHQDEDGRWAAEGFVQHVPVDVHVDAAGTGSRLHDIAVTGLAVFALAREGRPPVGDADHSSIDRATRWLAEQQGADGRLGTAASHYFIYNQAIGTLGLCAGAAATDSAKAREAAVKAVANLETHRNPSMAWRYQSRDGDNDMSVTTWCTLACVAARELDLAVSPALFDSVRMYIASLTDGDGRTGYTRAGEPSSRFIGAHAKQFPHEHCETLSAAALLCRQLLGQTTASDPGLPKTANLLARKPPVWRPADGAVDQIYWFLGSEALRHFGGEPERVWRKQLVAAATEGQRQDGAFAGSWDPVDPWGKEGGRIYATALSVMALQSLYPGRRD